MPPSMMLLTVAVAQAKEAAWKIVRVGSVYESPTLIVAQEIEIRAQLRFKQRSLALLVIDRSLFRV